MATGQGLTLIGRPAVRATVEISRTEPDLWSKTNTVRPSGVLMIESDSPVSIGSPTAPVPAEIGVTAPAPLWSDEATYRVGGADTGDAGAGRGPVRFAGTATATATITAANDAQATLARIRRRLRRRRPAATELATIGPVGGSSATARSSSARSDVSSIRAVLLLPEAGLGTVLLEDRPQLVQAPGALALHVAGRAAQQVRDLLHAQVGPVAHHHHHPHLGRQRGQRVEHDHPHLAGPRLDSGLGQPAGEHLPAAPPPPVGQVGGHQRPAPGSGYRFL